MQSERTASVVQLVKTGVDVRMPGPKKGSKYAKISTEMRQRLIEMADRGDDFIEAAKLLGISRSSAYKIVQKRKFVCESKGGAKNKKITNECTQRFLEAVENNPFITLNELVVIAKTEFDIDVTRQTISNNLDGNGYSVKKSHDEPLGMNSVFNKERRFQFACDFYTLQSEDHTFIYVDETNFNLFCKRVNGRSKKGRRVVRKQPNSRGGNLNIIGEFSILHLVCPYHVHKS